MRQATFPAIIDLKATTAVSFRRNGAMALRAPTWMPIDAKLLKPHSAYVDISIDRSWRYVIAHIQ